MGLNRFSLPVAAAIMMINASLLVQGCLEEERTALLQIKTSMFDPHPNHLGSRQLLSWGNDALCCRWSGVSCDNITGRVNKIVLDSARGLFFDASTGAWSRDAWYLNATLFLPFQELNTLDLGGNDIAGCVANEGFERLSRLNKLESLHLGFNNFNNSVLSSLKGLSSLKHLYLIYNQLNGSIDTKDFDSLSELEELDLSRNEIQNFVTSTGSERSLGLNKLEILGLSFNKFNDSSLSFLEGLSSLKHLYLYNNQLKGPMDMKGFERLSRLNKLESLNLGLNNFNNSILSSLKGLSSLKHLFLDSNQLNGSIDTKDFDSLSKLEVLTLSGNEIENFVTSTGFERPWSLDKLEILDLSSNRIKDSNLSFLKGLSSLKHLYLSNNQLKGPMDMKEFESVSKLVELRLEENEIQNFATSTGLCELKQLQELYISHNDLNGLPSCLANLTNLQVLDISSNEFTGNISLSPIGSLTSIRDLRLSDNRFRIPISLGPFFNLSNLKNLIGDNNEVYESAELEHNLIPRFQLQMLSLACNGFDGPFPRFLYYQQDLLYVDLS